MLLKCWDNNGEGRQSDVVAGINWAIEQNLNIINLSITSPYGSPLLQAALQKAFDQGISLWLLQVTHLLHLLDNTDVLFPARYPTVIAVGSVNNNLERSTFSYFGSNLDFVAPRRGYPKYLFWKWRRV